ncbi:putative RING-H2 finger protein ATL49 [Typha angustifolia]|uniref:putative RING-H2 finger protein ATL49 n=1 Tax=Typha angustifolia TaxID=59011 RepID=UPI003C2C6DA0
MHWVLHGSAIRDVFSSPAQLPLPFLPPPPPPPVVSPPPPLPPLPPPLSTPLYYANFENKISPSILLIIMILAVIFFISGLLHLLVRYLFRPISRDPEGLDNVTALQGQLQQLFHLHDAGVDQSFIDALPVFLYKAIIGLKDPFDCAVCLCEFEGDDKLRLLPKCSHAFHVQCIDTWLLSHSTCPLCRSSLLSEFPPSNSCSPVLLVLESRSESSREIIAPERGDSGPNAHLGPLGEEVFEPSSNQSSQKPEEIGLNVSEVSDAKVVPVKLGKFRSVEVAAGEGEGSSTSCNKNLDQRRCLSMGSYEYVMDDTSSLQVAIRPPKKKPTVTKSRHRVAMSECDCCLAREGFKRFDASRTERARADNHNSSSGIANLRKNESFSISKIWMKKDKPVSVGSSRRASSFRLPPADDSELKNSISSEADWDVEVGSCNNSVISSRAEEAPSFTRRTLLWVVGRQNKVGNDL